MIIHDDVDGDFATRAQLDRGRPSYSGGERAIRRSMERDGASDSDRRWLRGLLRRERDAIKYRRSYRRHETIDPYDTYAITDSRDISSANWTMQRYITAHPTVREYYNRGNKVFEDFKPKDAKSIGISDSDYVRVVDNVLYKGDVISDLSYRDKFDEDDLTEEEQDDVLDTWEMLDRIKDVEEIEFTKMIYY